MTASGAQTIGRAVELLKLIEAHQPRGLRLLDLARISGYERPTVHRLLKAMTKEGLVMQESDGKNYLLGPYCHQLGRAVSASVGVRELYSPLLKLVSAATGDASFLVVQSGFDTLCIARAIGTYPIQAIAISVGHRQPIGVGAGGLAILAAMPAQAASALIQTNSTRLPNYRGLDVKSLEKWVAQARTQGFSAIGNHAVSGVIGVGVALHNAAGDIVGGISVASIQARMTPERQAEVAQHIKAQMANFEPAAAVPPSVDE